MGIVEGVGAVGGDGGDALTSKRERERERERKELR
jgi:hypothetical protein